MYVAKSDCDEPGLEEDGERESLYLRMKDVFILSGGDCRGEIVSCRSSKSESELRPWNEEPAVGEKSGNGTAADASVKFETWSDEILETVCLLRGMTDLPVVG
jgi:hypothetical protein